MSEAINPRSTASTSSATSRRGQTLVEFALVLPLLLVMLLGIADFGRVFAAGITMEATSRNAAEAASQEYLQFRRAAQPSSPSTAAYDAVFDRAEEVACEEAETLANLATSGGDCVMPVIGACVHDEWGDHCGTTSASPPSGCSVMSSWPPAMADQAGGLPYVKVWTCYRFTTLMNLTDLDLPFGWSLSLGEIWLQRDRAFSVADY
jgi:TadE-like protein